MRQLALKDFRKGMWPTKEMPKSPVSVKTHGEPRGWSKEDWERSGADDVLEWIAAEFSGVFPHLCGLTTAGLETRFLALVRYVAFIDDSGNSPQEERFVLAGWVAPYRDWFYFSNEWDRRLREPRAIDYFKHTEAVGGKGCFQGFSESEIYDKARRLAAVIAERKELEAYCVYVKHSDYKTHFLNRLKALGVRPRVLKHYENQALFLTFHSIIPLILQDHFDRGIKGKIDFIFDDGKKPSKAAKKCIEWYNTIRDNLKAQGSPFYALMGKADTDEDGEMNPLQGADFLAGQVRQTLIYGNRILPAEDMLDGHHALYLDLESSILLPEVPRMGDEAC